MSTTAATLSTTTTRSHPVRRTTLAYGAVAAVASTGLAAAAHAAGVSLEVGGQMIPFAGFAQMVLLGAVLGGLLAAALNRYSAQAHRSFVRATVALTALSCVPSVALPHDAATKIVLVTTHVVAALIIVPALARQTR